MTETEFAEKCSILADLWMNWREDEAWQEFFIYNDLGLPLSYAVSTKMVNLEEAGEEIINETFELLLATLELKDTGFVEIDEMLDKAALGKEDGEEKK